VKAEDAVMPAFSDNMRKKEFVSHVIIKEGI